jgi:hypothetical protein
MLESPPRLAAVRAVEIVGEGRVLKVGEARPAVGRADNLLRDVGREPIAGHGLERSGDELQRERRP